MVWIKSILAAIKWSFVFILALAIVVGFDNIVSPEVFTILGFTTFFIFFTLENLALRY